MPKKAKKKKGDAAAKKKGKKAKGGKKKGKKKRKKGKKSKEIVVEVPQAPLLMDKHCIRTQILRPRCVLDVGVHRSRRGRLGNSVLNEIEPACKNWKCLKGLHVWGHNLTDAKRLAKQLFFFI